MAGVRAHGARRRPRGAVQGTAHTRPDARRGSAAQRARVRRRRRRVRRRRAGPRRRTGRGTRHARARHDAQVAPAPMPVQIGRTSLPHSGTNRTPVSPPPGTNRTPISPPPRYQSDAHLSPARYKSDAPPRLSLMPARQALSGSGPGLALSARRRRDGVGGESAVAPYNALLKGCAKAVPEERDHAASQAWVVWEHMQVLSRRDLIYLELSCAPRLSLESFPGLCGLCGSALLGRGRR